MKGYKVIREDMTHKGFKYQRGLNVDTKPFQSEGSCVEGGLYFFTDLKDLPDWLEYGDYLWELQVPKGAQCVQDPGGNKYRADKLILVKRHVLHSKNIWKQIAKKVDSKAIKAAALYGHLEIVRELIAYKAPVDEYAIEGAARNGHLEIVKELIAYNAPANKDVLYYVALYGHLGIVRELIEYKAPVHENAIGVAARNGHLEIVKDLIAYNAPVHEDALYWAAYKGYLDIVRELIKYNAPVDEDVIRYAKTEEIREVLKAYMKK